MGNISVIEYQELEKRKKQLEEYQKACEEQFKAIEDYLNQLASMAIKGERIREINALREEAENLRAKVNAIIQHATQFLTTLSSTTQQHDSTKQSELNSAKQGFSELL